MSIKKDWDIIKVRLPLEIAQIEDDFVCADKLVEFLIQADLNTSVVEGNIGRHFIDVNKLPARKEVCPTAQNILNTMSQVKNNLEKYNGISIRKASARIYLDFSSFYGQTLLNIAFIMENRRG